MTNYFIVRLGADSEKEIRALDAIDIFVSGEHIPIHVRCKQVPAVIQPGDFAIIWLGTNNNKGVKTPWIQGIRAFGRIKKISGEDGYGSQKRITITLGINLPRSITKLMIVNEQSSLYPAIAEMPVLGVNNYSSQVVQRIETGKSGQSIGALFAALDGIEPGILDRIELIYPELLPFPDEPLNAYLSAPASEKSKKNRMIKRGDRFEPLNLGSSTVDTEADDDGLEREGDKDSEKIETPFDPSKIDIVARPMTISALEDRLENSELDLTPDFQRQANVWDTKRKARLIESILLRIPLPSFYFSEDTDGGFAVVDGLQRLCAVFHFKNVDLLNDVTNAELPPLRLKGLQYLKELENKSFSELDRKFQRRISELEITANIIRTNTPSAVKFNVFARLNQGGMPLTAQEIRNAIFPGEWRNQIRELAESQEFIDATDGKVRTARQQDMELVLRYIALWHLEFPYRRPSGQTLDEFLNDSVEKSFSQWDEPKWNKARNAFYNALEATCLVRDKHAFRKSTGSNARMPINRGLFEAELLAFGSLRADELSTLASRKDLFEEEFSAALTSDMDFEQAMLYGTGSAESSNARIKTLLRIIQEVLNAE